METGKDFEKGEINEVSKKTHDRIKIKSSDRIIIRKKKRKVSDEEKVMSRQEILSLIEKIPKDIARFENKGLMYRTLIALLYLTGARISELLTVKKNQFEYAFDRGVKYLIINNVPTLKSRSKSESKYRPFFLRKDFEEPFINHVRAWLNELISDDELVFKINPSRSHQIVKEYTGKFPHYFRHVRSIDLVRYYGFNSYWLQRWHGWARINSAEAYVKLLGEDLKDHVLSINPSRKIS